MRKLYLCIILLVAVIALIGCSGEPKGSGSKRTSGIKVGVGGISKMILHSTSIMKSDSIMKSSTGNDGKAENVPEFDADGNVTSITLYNPDSTVNCIRYYTYTGGKKTRLIVRNPHTPSEQYICEYYDYKYDTEGRLSRVNHTGTFSTYDASEATDYPTKWTSGWYYEYTYNAAGLVSSTKRYNGTGGAPINTYTFTYNSSGDLETYSIDGGASIHLLI